MLEKEQALSVMKINCNQLDRKKNNPVYTESYIYQSNGISYSFEVSLSIDQNDTFLVNGHGMANFFPECSKCLGTFKDQLFIEFSDLYLKHDRDLLKYEMSFDGNVFLVDDGLISLDKSFEAAIAEAKVLVSLCHSACKGLCEHCGTDLNQTDCGCNQKITDPRFEALKNFKF